MELGIPLLLQSHLRLAHPQQLHTLLKLLCDKLGIGGDIIGGGDDRAESKHVLWREYESASQTAPITTAASFHTFLSTLSRPSTPPSHGKAPASAAAAGVFIHALFGTQFRSLHVLLRWCSSPSLSERSRLLVYCILHALLIQFPSSRSMLIERHASWKAAALPAVQVQEGLSAQALQQAWMQKNRHRRLQLQYIRSMELILRVPSS